MKFLTSIFWLGFSFFLFSYRQPQPEPSNEYKVKAVFLFNFSHYVEWPLDVLPEDDSPFVIGILGKDPFGSYLDETVKNEQVKKHPLVIQRFNRADEITACHILYIIPTDKDEMKGILDRLKSKNILTVSDASNFARLGGMIRLYTEANKTRIRINLSAVKKEELVCSSKLLRLADIVESQTH
ncbi:MAG: YfiR family protein [Cyclobacteriaceae bacterium]|nr:YfiR family protein [Cyclobacteriaceae bacterium]